MDVGVSFYLQAIDTDGTPCGPMWSARMSPDGTKLTAHVIAYREPAAMSVLIDARAVSRGVIRHRWPKLGEPVYVVQRLEWE